MLSKLQLAEGEPRQIGRRGRGVLVQKSVEHVHRLGDLVPSQGELGNFKQCLALALSGNSARQIVRIGRDGFRDPSEPLLDARLKGDGIGSQAELSGLGGLCQHVRHADQRFFGLALRQLYATQQIMPLPGRAWRQQQF